MDLISTTHFLNGLLMVVFPILLGIYLTSRFSMGWKLWLIGGFVFIISQVFHLPFNLYLLNPQLELISRSLPGISGALVVAILLGLSAGIFESFARYAMYRWWIKDARSWRKGVLAGAGYGGIEAILLGVLVLLVYFNMMAYRNVDLTILNLIPDQLIAAQQQIQAYWSVPWYLTLLGALERIFAISFHIAASLLVLQVFTRKPGKQSLSWLALAVLLHTFLDASAVFIAGQFGVYQAEAAIGFLALLSIAIIIILYHPEPISVSPVSEPIEAPRFIPSLIEETPENLENTRYQ